MTTHQITIQEFVQREIIYCVSSLVYTLTQENKLDEELAFSLWQGSIDYEAAEYEIEQAEDHLYYHEGYWGVWSKKQGYHLVDPIHNSKEEAIEEYFASEINNYRSEVFEHWIVSSWLFNKLQKHGETVVELYGLNIWCRCTTGQAIWCDYVVQEIYKELISE